MALRSLAVVLLTVVGLLACGPKTGACDREGQRCETQEGTSSGGPSSDSASSAATTSTTTGPATAAPETTAGTGPTSETTSESSTGAVQPLCTNLDEWNEDCCDAPLACGIDTPIDCGCCQLPMPCAPVDLLNEPDPDALQCGLDVLAGSEQAMVRFEFATGLGNGVWHVWLVEPGVAVVYENSFSDFSTTVTTQRCELSEFNEDCFEEEVAERRGDCLSSLITECSDEPTACPL